MLHIFLHILTYGATDAMTLVAGREDDDEVRRVTIHLSNHTDLSHVDWLFRTPL